MSATLDLHFERALLPGGWARGVHLRIDGARIAAVTADVPAPDGAERHALALPGVANGHSHAFQRAIAGLTQRRGATADSFWTWRETLYRFLDRLGPEELEAVTAQAYAEMLESGFTRVAEFHYVHHDSDGRRYADRAEMANRVAAAAAETGIALTLLPVYYAHGGFGGAPPTVGQRRFVCTPDDYARLLEASAAPLARLTDARLGVAPHSLRAVTAEQLAHAVALAGRRPIHIHIAEQQREVDDCLAWCGRRPVDWLLDHAPVDARWSLIHATHVTASELARLAASGASVGLCPITEADLGDGVFPARDFLAARGAISIGSDSNTLIDLAQELRLLEYGQRLVHRERNVLAAGPSSSTGRALYEAALAGGAAAVGDAAHGLVAGAPANLLTLAADAWAVDVADGDAVLDHWLFATRRPAIDRVWVAGRLVVAGGRHLRGDAIAARFRRALLTLTQRAH